LGVEMLDEAFAGHVRAMEQGMKAEKLLNKRLKVMG
jgi:hypothetical protein